VSDRYAVRRLEPPPAARVRLLLPPGHFRTRSKIAWVIFRKRVGKTDAKNSETIRFTQFPHGVADIAVTDAITDNPPFPVPLQSGSIGSVGTFHWRCCIFRAVSGADCGIRPVYKHRQRDFSRIPLWFVGCCSGPRITTPLVINSRGGAHKRTGSLKILLTIRRHRLSFPWPRPRWRAQAWADS
jgi:hypothetical protein